MLASIDSRLLAAGTTAVGIALVTVGGFVSSQYWQAVCVDAGVALFLFSYLWVAEHQMELRVERQAHLAAERAVRLAALGTPGTRAEAVDRGVRLAGQQLFAQGFFQHAAARTEIVFRDRPMEPRVEWQIRWGTLTGLVHDVAVLGDPLESIAARRGLVPGPEAVTEEEMRLLEDFLDEGQRLLRVVENMLAGAPATAPPRN